MILSLSCRPTRQMRAMAATGLAVLLATISAGPASARNTADPKRDQIIEPRTAGPPVLAVVSLSRQRVTIYDADGRIMRAPISTGSTGYETPAGIYSILQKKAEHHSNLYDDASMPFMQRITWSGIALHAGALPGRPASHGCVRMPLDFAERLFDVTKLGMRVVVMRDDIAPAEMTHPLLFKPASSSPANVSTAPGVSPVSVNADQPATAVQSLRAVAAAKTAELAAATKAAQEARAAAVSQNKENARAVKQLRMAQAAKAKADFMVHRTYGQWETATLPEAVERAAKAKDEALAQQAAAEAALAKVEAEVQPIQEAVAKLRETALAAEQARQAAEEQAKEVSRKLLPISIFVSRKTQRLYVRQSREPLFDVPVTIANPDEPLGTYVFTALNYTNDETDLRWQGVSLYNGTPVPAAAAIKDQQRRGAMTDTHAAATNLAAAKAALDRLSIPKDTMDRITEVISPGSSFIISDEEISRETGSGTDFIIVMSTEPQGGIAIRRRPNSEGFRDRFDRPFSRSFAPYRAGPPSFW